MGVAPSHTQQLPSLCPSSKLSITPSILWLGLRKAPWAELQGCPDRCSAVPELLSVRCRVGGDIGSQLEKRMPAPMGTAEDGFKDDVEDRTHIEHDKG